MSWLCQDRYGLLPRVGAWIGPVAKGASARLLLGCLMLLFFLNFLGAGLQAASLEQLVQPRLRPGDAFAYRSGQQVLVFCVEKTEPLILSQHLLAASDFFHLRPWTRWLPLLKQRSPQTSNPNLLQALLSLELVPVQPMGRWRPELEILRGCDPKPAWQTFSATLGDPFASELAGKQVTLYLAQGPGCSKLGLPEQWPYWIERQEKLRKWVLYLVAYHCRHTNSCLP